VKLSAVLEESCIPFVFPVNPGLIDFLNPKKRTGADHVILAHPCTKFRDFLPPALLGIVVFAINSAPAYASDYETSCAPACHYETITVYIPKTVSHAKCVTLYDQCGRPYEVNEICCRTVQVPVRKCVLVCGR
jgi:hypothetical protein